MIGRLEKNVIIARSGVYKYEPSALKGLKPSGTPPDGYENKSYFNVYRPATAVADSANLFIKLPLIREHQAFITPQNYREYSLGWTGDSVEVVPLEGTNEIGIQSSVNLLDEEAIGMYEDGFRDVSPFYGADFRWASGTTADGKDYDIVMDKVNSVNHLAFTQQGRGGAGVCMDSDVTIAVATAPVTESAKVDFDTVVRDIIDNRADYDDAAIVEGVDALRSFLVDIPDSDDKKVLSRLIDDFLVVKNAFPDDEAAKVAADSVVSRYKALDAKEDTMGMFGHAKDAAPVDPKEAPKTDVPAQAPAEAPKATPDAPPATPPAPAPATPAVAPVAAAMEVAQMPDDISGVTDDAQLAAVINGLIKFAKSIAPGEAQEPQHQEALAAPAVGDSPAGEEDKKGMAGDSLFAMSLGDSKTKASGLADFTAGLYRSKK